GANLRQRHEERDNQLEVRHRGAAQEGAGRDCGEIPEAEHPGDLGSDKGRCLRTGARYAGSRTVSAATVAKVAFYGSIRTSDADEVSLLLQDWLETHRLQIEVGRLGVEIVYEDEELYIYCHEAGTEPGMRSFYLVEGHVAGTLDNAAARLRELMKLC